MAKEVSSLLEPDPRVPLEQWIAQAHMKDMNALHILLSHTAHQEKQLKEFTQGSNWIQMAFRKMTRALHGRREIFLFKIFSATV